MTDLYFPGYIAELRAAQTVTPSLATTSPSRDALGFPPLDPVVAGDSILEGAAS